MTTNTVSRRRKPTPMMKRGTYTATQVLLFVRKIITEEAHRLDMRTWVSMFKGRWVQAKLPPSVQPGCGTVACLAGWIGVVTRIDNPHHIDAAAALQKLGLIKRNEWKEGVAHALNQLFYDTRLNRNAVIQRLDHIIHIHQKILDTTKVVVR